MPVDGWKLADPDRGRRIVDALRQALGPELFSELHGPLARLVPRSPDPDMALNNLERFLSSSAARAQLPALLEHRARKLDTLLQLLGTSQLFADVLTTYPEFLDLLRTARGRAIHPTYDEMLAQLRADVAAAGDDPAVLRAFRRFRQRHVLRIGVGDVVRDRPLEETTLDLSRTADAALQVALEVALRTVAGRYGNPVTDDGRPARCAVFAFGKLGGEELNYSSDVDLLIVYDEEGETTGKLSNEEFYGRVVSEVVRLLSSFTDRGQAYRVDLRLRPEGDRGPLARSLASTLSYYDGVGRTWERQALVKLRPVAGDAALGDEFLRAVEGFVYRKYFSFAEINDVKAMKRRIEQKTHHAGDGERDVKTGRGGIRDVEFTVQFLQLLNGGDLPEVRRRNTLDALHALGAAGCLTDQEVRLLETGYRFLRKTEHRLQILFDRQTHRIPDGLDEQRKLALRMGYRSGVRDQGSGVREPAARSRGAEPVAAQRRSPLDEPTPTLEARDLLLDPLEKFLHDCYAAASRNRTILDHLLHQTFAGDDQAAEPESDLILDPDPDEATVWAVLGRYPFRDVPGAYRNLAQLAQETVRFLSARRCRHFLASIAPRLLRAVAETPDPDAALRQLEQVSASLGAKAILWELFSFNPPSLKLYVDLCANSPFLSGILVNNPGMIDELLDSLVLNQPRTLDELRDELAELCRGATDLDPILHSFRDKELLRVGVRDLLRKHAVRETTAALSDVAEAVLEQVVRREEHDLRERCGEPVLTEGERTGRPCRYAVLALGRLGGREMSYHSDLDLVFVYEGDGAAIGEAAIERPSNDEWFTQMAQRVVRAASQMGPRGSLYAVDLRLRPAGRSGSLVVPLGEFRRYYRDGDAQVWERQALLRARPVYGDPAFARAAALAVRDAALGDDWCPAWAEEVRSMRARLEAGASSRSLKRARGGTMDVEFVVAWLQLVHGRRRPEVLATNVWTALDALHDDGLIDDSDHGALRDGYSFLRGAEGRLRVVENRAVNECPETDDGVAKLARRLGYDAAERFRTELEWHRGRIRERFERLVR